jgi:hypothetical protein
VCAGRMCNFCFTSGTCHVTLGLNPIIKEDKEWIVTNGTHPLGRYSVTASES